MISPEEHLVIVIHHLKMIESETEPNKCRDKIHNIVDECKCLMKEYSKKDSA